SCGENCNKDNAQSLEGIKITQIEALQQPESHEKGNRNYNDAHRDARRKMRVTHTVCRREFHRSFEDELRCHKRDQRNEDEQQSEKTHKRSSIFAIGFTTKAKPKTTSAIPHQRNVEISSPRKIQQPNGTRISTTRESG